ncbi:MAG TPA: ATP synthase F1 subunit delta [Candidatus Eremiobacteraceae bacterium]|nr:ATP synthase F1 subunit delta [Candidatus Eremiobacteraceae bacterium]
MLKESIAKRYSSALYDLARERAEIAVVTAQLDSFVAALKSDSELYGFYASPVVDRRLKEQILHSVLDGHAGELTLNFIVLLVRKRRENLIEIVARQMHEMLDRDAGRQPATVGTPMPLGESTLHELAQRLSSVYGHNIIPQTKVAPELLGGLVVQVGDRYVDGSVSGKLEELRRHLLAITDSWATTSPQAASNGRSQESQS